MSELFKKCFNEYKYKDDEKFAVVFLKLLFLMVFYIPYSVIEYNYFLEKKFIHISYFFSIFYLWVKMGNFYFKEKNIWYKSLFKKNKIINYSINMRTYFYVINIKQYEVFNNRFK